MKELFNWCFSYAHGVPLAVVLKYFSSTFDCHHAVQLPEPEFIKDKVFTKVDVRHILSRFSEMQAIATQHVTVCFSPVT